MIRSIGDALRTGREDAGISQRRLARVSGVSQSHLSAVEAGVAEPSVALLVAIAAALGGELSVRFFPGTGPRIRDRIQAAMVEAVLRQLDPRWTAFPEVPVYRPARGVIDLVLAEHEAGQLVASEFHSQLRRFEQQLRWARAKADSLQSTSIGALAGIGATDGAHVSQLLVLRSTRDLRLIADTYTKTFALAYPARTRDVFDALTGGGRWPDSGVLWISVDGRKTHVMRDPPRGVSLGR